MRPVRAPLLFVALCLACGLAQAQSAAAPPDANTAAPPGPEGVILATHSASGLIPLKSWKTLRDHRGLCIMQLKHTFVALAAAGLLSTQAYASEAQIEAAIPSAQPVAAFTDADMQALFGQDAHKPMQLAALSGQEMKETEGALAPWAFGGLVGGTWQGANYAWGAYRGNYVWNTSRFVGNVGTGASFGTAGHIASGGAKFIPSLTNAGANIWRFNAGVANWGRQPHLASVTGICSSGHPQGGSPCGLP